jgi:hypothetical protein
MTNQEKQLIISSYLGDAYWMKQKRVLRIKFGGYVKNYLEYKQSLISTLQHSKLWGSVNKKSILYEFTVGKNKILDSLKEENFWTVEKKLGGLNELGFALLMFDDGTYHRKNNYYCLSIGKVYSYNFANNFTNYINKKFNLRGTRHKTIGCKGYFIQFKVHNTPTIANILNKFSNHDYKYKIPPPETIVKIASRYKDIPKDLEGRRAYNIVRSLQKCKES